MNERPKTGQKPILCLDFDGVIHSYKSGWQGATVIPDPPVPGVFEWMEAALVYFDIHIFSSRSDTAEGRLAIQDYIGRHAKGTLASRLIYAESKPHAFLSIDDRAIQFSGRWSDLQYDPEKLRKFEPWYKLRNRRPV